MENVKRFVKPTRYAQMIDAGKSKVYAMLKNGEIPYVRIGGMIRVDVEKALAQLNAENEASGAR
jgi:excisionase family DNA binding protein